MRDNVIEKLRYDKRRPVAAGRIEKTALRHKAFENRKVFQARRKSYRAALRLHDLSNDFRKREYDGKELAESC